MPTREYSGNSKATTVVGTLSATAVSILLADGTGYPTGAVGPFVVTLDTGLAGEEKVLCASRSGNTLTVATGGRGFDSTTAADHNNGAPVAHTYSATDAREANAHVNDVAGDPHPQYIGNTGGDTITASGPTVRPLVVKGAAASTVSLIEGQNSAGTVLTAVNASGFFGAPIIFAGGADANLAGATLHTKSRSTGETSFIAQGATGQTADIARVINSDATALLVVTPAAASSESNLSVNVGAVGLRRLVVGAVDSAGAGFRTVRVAN